MPLFIRKKYSLKLTSAGKVYINGLKKIMRIENEIISEINDLENLERGSIVIGATNYMNSFILAPILKKFKDSYPNITLKLLENTSPKSLGLLNEDTIEVTFSCSDLSEKDYKLSHVFTDEVILAIPKNMVDKKLSRYALNLYDIENKAYDNKRVKIDNFKNLPYILLNPNNNLNQRANSMLNSKEENIDIIMYVDQVITAHSFSINGIGATFIGSYLLPREYNENVSYFAIDSPISKRKFNLVMKKETYESYAIKELIREMREYYL